MNLKIANVVKYAQGTAPFAGIPIEGVGTIVLLRRHLRAALEIQPVRIIYNQDTKVLTFRNHRAEQITGKPVGESQTYARIHARKRYRHGLPDYPDREDYLKNLPRYLVMSEKPWDWRPCDLLKKDEYGEQLNALQHHARARLEYCAALRERKALDGQIEAHLAEITTHGTKRTEAQTVRPRNPRSYCHAPETSFDGSQLFSPSDMQSRSKKLKAAGKIPPLADVLKVMNPNRCRRSNGTFRAWFATAAEAVAFADDPANLAYQGDVAVQCQEPDCGGWHLSRPHWPDAVAAAQAMVN